MDKESTRWSAAELVDEWRGKPISRGITRAPGPIVGTEYALADAPFKETRPARILVIDDNRAFADFVVRVFAQQGIAVGIAGAFSEAVAMAAENPPGRVISELRVKDQYLFEHMGALVETIPPGKLVVITAYPSIATAVQFVKMGVAAYVTKPVSAPMLADVCLADSRTDKESDQGCRSLSWPTLDRTIWEYISHVHVTAGSISEAARRLGLDRRSLRRMLAKYPPIR